MCVNTTAFNYIKLVIQNMYTHTTHIEFVHVHVHAYREGTT